MLLRNEPVITNLRNVLFRVFQTLNIMMKYFNFDREINIFIC